MKVLRDIAGVLLCAAGYHDEERLRPGVYECCRPTCLRAREVEHEKDPEREARADALMMELRMVAAARDVPDPDLGRPIDRAELTRAIENLPPSLGESLDANARELVTEGAAEFCGRDDMLDMATIEIVESAYVCGIEIGIVLAAARVLDV